MPPQFKGGIVWPRIRALERRMESAGSKPHRNELSTKSPFDLIVNQIWRSKSSADRLPQSPVSRFFKGSDNSIEAVTEKWKLRKTSLDSENKVSNISDELKSADVDNSSSKWEQVAEFMERLGKKPDQRCLNLNNSRLTANDAVQLGDCIQHLPNLEEIDLSWNSDLGGNLSLITRKLKPVSKLKVVKLIDCNLTPEDGRALGKALSSTTGLEVLDLSMNKDVGSGLGILFQELKHVPHLQVLKLHLCGLTKDNFSDLGDALEQIPGVKKLVFSCNDIGGGFKDTAVHLLTFKQLQVFDVHQCSLTEEDLSAFTQIIPLLSSLQVLNFALNKSSGNSVRHLISRLRFLPRLKSLVANNCNLTKESIVELADTIPNLTELEILDLSWNKCLGGNLGVLFRMLQSNTRLQVLKLSSCNLTSRDLASLVAVSSTGFLESLKKLDLTYNNTIDDESWVMFFQEVSGLKELSELDIGVRPLTHRECGLWLMVLLDSLSRYPLLIELGMSNWVLSASQRDLLDTFNKDNKRNIHFAY
ncbi:leucine-rich repeat-containing protein 31-like isoform X3 [Mustelus asterias]